MASERNWNGSPVVVQGNFINIRRISDGVLEVQGGPAPDACIAELLRSYLRLDEDIEAIYTDISKRDRKIAELVRKYRGLRILRQEPWECLVSYICSGNNSVAQISRLGKRQRNSRIRLLLPDARPDN